MNQFPPCFTDFLICVLLIFISVPVPFEIVFFLFHQFFFLSTLTHPNLENENVLIEESKENYFLLQKLILTFDYLLNLHHIQNKL